MRANILAARKRNPDLQVLKCIKAKIGSGAFWQDNIHMNVFKYAPLT